MSKNILLLIALFGLLVPNGLFLSASFYEHNDLAQITQNKLALGFMIDAFMVVGLLAYYFAKKPIGKIRWYWFIALSLIGGLGFSLPLYWWLNRQGEGRASAG